MGEIVSEKKEKPSLLLHSCCGPCSTAVIERLYDDYKITVFYFNPNITDEEEYQLRKGAQRDFIQSFNEEHKGGDRIDLIEGDHDPEVFFRAAKGLEDEPEGGARCAVCFRLRLAETAALADEKGFQLFATTLTVSPHKDYSVISGIGKELEAVHKADFLDMDFKKKAGFQRSIELSKRYGLYRQDHCGCSFARKAQEKYRKQTIAKGEKNQCQN